jgi:glutamine synthetase type III
MTLEEKVAVNETNISNIVKTLDNFGKSYSDFKEKIFEKLDIIGDEVLIIKTKVNDEEKNRTRSLDIKLVIWGLIISAVNIGIKFIWR